MTNTSRGRAGGEESIDNEGDLDVDLEGGNRPSTCEVIDWSGTLTLTARLACLGGQSYRAPQPAPHLCCEINELGGRSYA